LNLKDKEFSEEKMEKPINLLNYFVNYLNFSSNYCNEKVKMKRLNNLNEATIFTELNKTKQIVHDALCNDFNTCLVIEKLFDLVNLMNKNFQPLYDDTSDDNNDSNDIHRHYGCIMSVSSYVKSILDMFGLELDDEGTKHKVIVVNSFLLLIISLLKLLK
jgi:cysteinyl-tRNA synthetase